MGNLGNVLGILLVLAATVGAIVFRKGFADTIDRRTRERQAPMEALLGSDHRRFYEAGVVIVAPAVIGIIVLGCIVALFD